TTSGDGVGDIVWPLSNGNYVVASPSWDNGTVGDAGAATWGDGNGGTVGTISAANSLVGSTTVDKIGYYGVVALANGKYVVDSPYWDRGTIADAGAVTFTSGASGIVGLVSQSNSLVGSTAGDQIGSDGGVRVLSNGNYVVDSQYFDSGTLADAGAMTFG